MRSDAVFLSVLQSRMKAIAEEMGVTMLRTAHTVFVKETQDFGTCLVSPRGEVIAAPVESGVSHLSGLPAGIIAEMSHDYSPGDVIISNEPDLTKGMSTHLNDIWMWKPIFRDDRIVAYAVTFIHSTDVSGKVPGSISPSNEEVYQEGLRIPICKLVEKGVINRDVVNFLLLNTRIPGQQWGDIKAQMATINIAEARVHELIDRYGLEQFETGVDDLLDLAEARVRKLIGEIPDGDYEFSDYLEADHVGAGLIRIKLTMKVRGTDMVLDFTGTDHQVRAALNLPSWNQRGHRQICVGLLSYFRTMDPWAPYNSGVTRPIELHIPRGTLLNPEPEAAYGVRAATMFRVMDVIMGCLYRALPQAMPAAGSGALAIVLLAMWDPASGERRVEVAQPLTGGSGARPKLDGIDAVSGAGGFLRNVPNEILENDLPVVVESYGYRPDSGGPGRRRGGVGLSLRLRINVPDTHMTARGLERFVFAPWGVQGGQPGARSRIVLNPGTPRERVLEKVDLLKLDSGDVLQFETPGGGGWGDPMTRDPQHVADDVRLGLISVDHAEQAYGVVLADGAVDPAATAARRAGRTLTGEPPLFDLGAERTAYERLWRDEVSSWLVERLARYPARLRPMLLGRIRQFHAGDDHVTLDQIAGTVDRMVVELGLDRLVNHGEARPADTTAYHQVVAAMTGDFMH